jgi:hypothetical protein
MMYVVEYEVPGDAEIYGQVKAAIGDEHPEGLVVHLVVQTAGGLRHTEVWDSADHQERFRRERAEPAVHGVLRSLGFTEAPPDPAMTALELVDVVTGS